MQWPPFSPGPNTKHGNGNGTYPYFSAREAQMPASLSISDMPVAQTSSNSDDDHFCGTEVQRYRYDMNPRTEGERVLRIR